MTCSIRPAPLPRRHAALAASAGALSRGEAWALPAHIQSATPRAAANNAFFVEIAAIVWCLPWDQAVGSQSDQPAQPAPGAPANGATMLRELGDGSVTESGARPSS